jgi:flagellar motility protein MotE (MotC chaperone)
VAQMAGLTVFGPDGERIGKVRDVVSALRVDQLPPRVRGLVVELVTRQRIFVPMLRVTAIDPGAVTLSTGTITLRRFAQRPGEILVLGELLDAHVHVAETGEAVVVVDAAIERTRSQDWVISRLAVRPRRHRLGRRPNVRVLDWSEFTGLSLSEENQGAEGLLAVFESMRAADVAAALRELPEKRRFEVVDALPDERLADVFQELPESVQRELLGYLDDDRAADILEAMDPDDAADLLAELPSAESDRFLSLMQPEESAPVRRLLRYSANTAGGLMTPEPLILTPDATIAEALARVRNPDVPPALASMVFVCRPPTATPTGRYLGCAHLQRLLREPPADLVAGVLDDDLARLHPEAQLSQVTRYFATYNLVCGPVVDDNDHLLGAVTVDDVLDHLLPAGWREREDARDNGAGGEAGRTGGTGGDAGRENGSSTARTVSDA